MPRMPLGLLSFGVFVIIVAISIVVSVSLQPSLPWGASLALIVTLYGGWTIALAGIRVKNPEKYARGAYSIFVWGILLVAVGGAWFIYSLHAAYWLYAVLLLLIVIGILAVVSALRGFKK